MKHFVGEIQNLSESDIPFVRFVRRVPQIKHTSVYQYPDEDLGALLRKYSDDSYGVIFRKM